MRKEPDDPLGGKQSKSPCREGKKKNLPRPVTLQTVGGGIVEVGVHPGKKGEKGGRQDPHFRQCSGTMGRKGGTGADRRERPGGCQEVKKGSVA